jgi:hypothetical protein
MSSDGSRVSSASVDHNGSPDTIVADVFFSAVPAEKMAGVLSNSPDLLLAAPSLRLLRHAQLGHVSLRTLRRMRVPTGSLVPSGVAETLAALVLVWVGASCHDALRRAAMPGG